MSKVNSVIIVGVGGQGTLLASRILGDVMLDKGYDVKVSEVHGMSQRGGSVITYVRYGEKVHSPIIENGEADLILAFEQLEAARYLPYLKEGGDLIVNTQCIDPMPVITGNAVYPENITDKISDLGVNVTAIEAHTLAKEAGNVKAVNVVLIGAMASKLDLPKEIWINAIKENVPPKFLELNLKAFDLAYNK